MDLELSWKDTPDPFFWYLSQIKNMSEQEHRIDGGTLRADGTRRKALKIRPGFKREEDIERYDVSKVRERRLQRMQDKYTPEQQQELLPQDKLQATPQDIEHVNASHHLSSVSPKHSAKPQLGDDDDELNSSFKDLSIDFRGKPPKLDSNSGKRLNPTTRTSINIEKLSHDTKDENSNKKGCSKQERIPMKSQPTPITSNRDTRVRNRKKQYSLAELDKKYGLDQS